MGFRIRLRVAGLVIALAAALPAWAQSPFEGGWTLRPEMSALSFQSVKKGSVVEQSRFAALTGEIAEDGTARVTVMLDSVDTKIDLRNVRMRFLFFETFKFPEAVITTRLDPAMLDDLPRLRRKQLPVSYDVDLHGVVKSYESTVTATLLGGDMVSVASAAPILIPVADFDLTGGLEKLQEAASVDIMPTAAVYFDWVFARNGAGEVPTPLKSETVPQSVALEVDGNFDSAACKGRFEILSRAGNIYFASGSARLEAKSGPLLDSLAGIVSRCPGMVVEVGGHTDSIGPDSANMRLSEARAASVVTYLQGKGVAADAMVAKGYGEMQPIAGNATEKGRWDNRRIEFIVLEN